MNKDEVEMSARLEGVKTCSRCKAQLPVTHYFGDNRTSDKKRSECKDCSKARNRDYYARNKEGWHDSRGGRNRELLRKYGISESDYDSLLFFQNGLCAICLGNRYPKERLCVDHDHISGKVRGLLCRVCNLGLGKFDSLELARNVVSYLERV